jgi:hypothetical protein
LPTTDLESSLESLSNQIHHLVRNRKRNFYSSKFHNAKTSKQKWSCVNSVLGRNRAKNKIGKIEDGQVLTENNERKATLFNDYFSNIGKTLAESIERRPTDNINKFRTLNMSMRSIFFSPCSDAEVALIIQNLEDGKSPGSDRIGVTLVKRCRTVLSSILTKIFNDCITVGIYPDGMKVARVVPIYKGGSKKEISNYRPISVLSVFNKIFEKLIYERLASFLEHQTFFYQQQYGFRSRSN